MPTIAIATVAADDRVNLNESIVGFAIGGTTTGVPNGRLVTVHLLDAGNGTIETLHASVNANAWTVQLTGAQAMLLTSGGYTITADVSDLAGNAAPQATHSLAVDTIGPEVASMARVDGASSNAASVHYTVTFSEAVTGVTTASFALATTGIPNAAVTGLTGSGTTYTVTVSTGTGDGTVALVTNGAAVTDLAGNGLRGAALQPPVTYGTGMAPVSVAIADVNADGRPDLAVANYDANSVSVLLGNGNGTFQPLSSYATGAAPRSVAIGDLNGDGRPDLAIANETSDTVSILLGNGNGTFQTQVGYSVGDAPSSLAIGDLNGDGRTDLAVADRGSDWVSILIGNGDGTFQTPSSYATQRAPRSAAIGDLNGDGTPDLAVANDISGSVSILLGNGDGTFRTQAAYAVGDEPWSVAMGDLNGDGRLDLALAPLGGASVLLGNGDGTFQPAATYAAGGGPASVAIADVSGDGRADLAVVNQFDGTISVLLGNGNGTFQPQVTYAAGNTPLSLAIGDVNLDGKPDFAATTASSNGVSILLNAPASVTGPAYAIDRTAPVAVNDIAAVNEDASITGNVITGQPGGAGRDSEPTGQSLSVTAFSGPNGPGMLGQPLVGALGTLTLNGNGSYTFLADQAAADPLAPGAVATDTFHYTVSDPAGNTATADLVVTVRGVNDAPVLADFALVLTNESEDAAAPAGAVGTPIAALVGGGNVTDADAGAPRGLAVTGADTAHGKWFYSTNGGTTWIALGSVAEGNARLLAADAGTRIYFQPDANFNGSIDPALTFHAWDQSSGTNGGAANLTIIRTGGTSAFSTATDTASLSITSVNDPPSFTRGPNQTVDEDSGPQTVSGWATNISAGPPDESGQTVHFNVVDNTNPGLFNSGPTIGTNGALTYTPAANANGTATITIMAQDDGGTSGGGRDISAAQTFQITINPVNDAPVAIIAAATYVATEQVSMNLKNTGISVSDVDAVLVPSGVETATLSVTEGILNVAAGSSGVLVSNSGTSSVTLEGTLAQINALLNTNPTSSVSYVDPTNLPSPTATLTLTIHDNGRTGAGGDLFASDTAIINITPVNDAVADFNGDGHTDLLWRQDDGQTAIWLMNGSRIVVGFDLGKIGTSWRALDRGDFDGDSRADILWRNDDGQTAIWEMDGGIIKRGVSLGVIGSPWQLQPIGDFDGDGKSDLLWRNEQTGETGLWEMNGGEIKAGISLGVIGAGWHVAGVADFDGDGKSDILWRHDSGQTAIWAMNGGQIKAGFGLGTIATSSHVVGTGDFDGDGKDDILWHDDNGLTAIWEMNGGQIKHTDNLGVIGPSWHVATIGDFDGNGTSDILWRDDNGQTALWQMNGGQTIAGADLGLIASAWHVVSDHLLV